jgi:hypothetical protein
MELFSLGRNMNQYRNLTKLFSSRKLPVIISDSNYVLDAFFRQGFDVISLIEVGESECAPDEVLLANISPENSLKAEKFEKTFGNSSVLIVPLMSFSGDNRSIDYFISRLKDIDFEEACIRGKARLEQIQNLSVPLEITYKGCSLVVELGQDIDVFVPKIIPTINKGEWISVSQFLEVALIPNEKYTCFKVDGEFICEGISVAFHRGNHGIAKPIANEAWRIFSDLRNQKKFPLMLEIKNSEVTKILTSDGEDILKLIRPLTDEVFHGRLIEVSFASLSPSEDTDWSINSQINEAAGGVHLALGTGVKAAHIDFISPFAFVNLKY